MVLFSCNPKAINILEKPAAVLHPAGFYIPMQNFKTEFDEDLHKVKDNESPEEIKKKIFQPFFTTKQSGEGTGLGLRRSYNIITKGHNGTLEVETKEGEGTEFIFQLKI